VMRWGEHFRLGIPKKVKQLQKCKQITSRRKVAFYRNRKASKNLANIRS